MKISTATLIIGLTTGLTYAILAVGLVLVFKAARFINFAHGQLGALSALLLAKAVGDWNLPYLIVFPVVIALGAGLGVLVELGILRRLFDAPRLVLMVATIGVGQFLFALSFLGPFQPDTTRLVRQGGYPTPIGWRATVGGYVLRGGEFMVLICVPVAALLIAWLFRATRTGLRIQSVAANPDAARLAGISVRRASTTVWALAGALSALTAILLGPFRGTVNTEILGPSLMTRALAAALVGSMTSLPITFAAGIGLGIVEQIAFANFARGGTTELVAFVVMMGMLLYRAQALSRESRRAEESLMVSTTPPPLPPEVASATWPGWIRRGTLLALLGFALILPALPGFRTQSQAFLATQALAFAIVGLSLVIVTGWSGQLSLGQFAFVGVGAFTAARLTPKGFSFPAVVIVAGLIGAGVAVLVGLPALKVRGLFLGVSTLAFAVVAQGWVFNQAWVTGGRSSSVSVPRPRLPVIGVVRTGRGLYYIGVGLLVVLALMIKALNGSGLGRRLIAVRDNAKAAAAHGITPSVTNITGFALSGFVAAAGGVLWGYNTVNFDSNAFFPSISLTVLAMVVIGGLGSTTGAVIGSVAIFGLPLFLKLSPVYVFFLSGILLLATLVFLPNGLVSLVWRVRDFLLRTIARSAATAAIDAPDENVPAVRCESVSVRFGGVVALDDVSLVVQPGEIVGLIGANGAGKTTLMDCISGYLRPAAGRISVNGHDVQRYAAEFRPYFGVGRSFQDARLYPGLTVLETIMVAQERDDHAGLTSLLSAPWHRHSERKKRARADEIIDLLGLHEFRDRKTSELPTGLRRVCDLGTVVMQQPRLLLLDEPTAGLSQQDVEAFVPLLRRIHADLGCAIVIIEHDMGVILGLAQRIYALEAGRVIAEGPSDEVARHPQVVASYLGTDRATIERSRQQRVASAVSEPVSPAVHPGPAVPVASNGGGVRNGDPVSNGKSAPSLRRAGRSARR